MSSRPEHAFVPYPATPVPHAAAGPLAGLVLGVKDLFDIAGYPTGGGSPIVLARSGLKTRTAPVVQRLLDAGARLAGKTSCWTTSTRCSGASAGCRASRPGARTGR